MSINGRSRASTFVYAGPESKSRVIEVLRPNDPIDVQGEAGEMFAVESKRLSPPIAGYVSKSAIARRILMVEVFPKIEMNDGTVLDPAPSDLLAVEFEAWLHTQGEPTWLFEDGNAPFLLGDKMRKEFEGYREAWKEWYAEVIKNNLLKTATLGDWYIVTSGGKEMWSSRSERIFKEPTERSTGLGWVGPADILHWTGRVRYSEKEWKYKLWYEVELTKLDRTIRGWYKADLLEEFVIPEVYVESNDRAGIAALFDMSRPKLRLPADIEIDEARIAKRSAYQYIDVQKVNMATGWVSNKYLTRLPPPLIANYHVTATTLRVRSGPGRDYDIIGNLYYDNIVKGDEIVNDWIHITTADNKAGWSHGRYLKLQEELGSLVGGMEKYQVNVTNLNLRQGPGMKYAEIGSLQKDEVIDGLVASSDGDWVQVQRSTMRRKINYNLCGQFCVAALCGLDVMPLLQKWYESSQRGKAVIDADHGTIVYDLQEILELYNVKSEIFQPEPSVAPATPGYLEKMLRDGKKAIIGVGLTPKGEAAYNASLRHWLVLEDIARMGNSGWVRVYNSYFNREEIYPYQHIFNTGVATGIGLWVDAPDYHPLR